jgi:RNA-directed DNA polymerase
MTGKRQAKQQGELPLDGTSEVPMPPESAPRVEPVKATDEPGNLAGTEQLMEEVCERGNLLRALKQVKANRGAPGVDGMTVQELPKYLKTNWPRLREQLLSGSYEPKPVKRVEIPKPTGGVRLLGIPCAVDRFIQQAALQVLQARWDSTFSEHSYGFRPGRSAHQAVLQAQQYVAEGYVYSVDLDLEKFFDRVNHDMLMARVARRIADKRLLRLIRAFLKAGIMDHGLVSPPTDAGVPQGGPLSPLLSNLFLDELDRELERRGHRFVRYADDCNIYVKSERAGGRVLETVKKFLGKKLKLRVNEQKSKVSRADQSKFLGFSITVSAYGGRPRRRISAQSLERFKKKVVDLTRRSLGQSLAQVIRGLNQYLLGWRAYYGFSEIPRVLRDLDSWIRRRLRSYLWEQWKTYARRRDTLRSLGLKKTEASRLAWAGCHYGPWHMSKTMALHMVLTNRYFASQGLVTLAVTKPKLQPNRHVRTRTHGGVGGLGP